jgi:metal-responsive CopG/Arc/MetJ family transcriptional regulator
MKENNKIKIMSLSLDCDMHELIKKSAKKLGHKNVSQLIRDLVSKYLDLHINDAEDIPVILRIPNNLKENASDLRSWLNQKSEAITNALTKNNGNSST